MIWRRIASVRVPHHRGLDQLQEVVPHEAPRVTAEPAVARSISRVRALRAPRQMAHVRAEVIEAASELDAEEAAEDAEDAEDAMEEE